MSEQLKLLIRNLLRESNSDKTNLVPLLRQIRQVAGPITKPMVAFIASELNLHYSAVLDTASFYTFLDFNRTGKIAIRLAKTPISLMKGADELATAFEKALGVKMGGTSSDSQFSLSWTSDLGMSDQEPSALIEDWPLTRVSPNHVPEIIQLLRSGLPLSQHDHSRVDFGIQRKGPVLFSEHPPNEGLQKALLLAPENIIEEVTRSRLRGRGGAGFPTGLKWKSCRSFAARDRVVICNADEGEPGTFKDRVLLSEVPELLLEGMTIAAWAIGASIGIIYLRAEYAYLKPLLDKHLEERREKGLLGTRIHDKDFSFDIQIHMGAGAYICGEESARVFLQAIR